MLLTLLASTRVGQCLRQRKLSWSHKNCVSFWVSASTLIQSSFDSFVLLNWEYLPCTIACLEHVTWFQFLQSHVPSICLSRESEPACLISVEITITRSLGSYLNVLCFVEWSWALKHHVCLPYCLECCQLITLECGWSYRKYIQLGWCLWRRACPCREFLIPELFFLSLSNPIIFLAALLLFLPGCNEVSCLFQKMFLSS